MMEAMVDYGYIGLDTWCQPSGYSFVGKIRHTPYGIKRPLISVPLGEATTRENGMVKTALIRKFFRIQALVYGNFASIPV